MTTIIETNPLDKREHYDDDSLLSVLTSAFAAKRQPLLETKKPVETKPPSIETNPPFDYTLRASILSLADHPAARTRECGLGLKNFRDYFDSKGVTFPLITRIPLDVLVNYFVNNKPDPASPCVVVCKRSGPSCYVNYVLDINSGRLFRAESKTGYSVYWRGLSRNHPALRYLRPNEIHLPTD